MQMPQMAKVVSMTTLIAPGRRIRQAGDREMRQTSFKSYGRGVSAALFRCISRLDSSGEQETLANVAPMS
jgi:hypothetical protein